MLLIAVPCAVNAAATYESPTEFLASGDFNGDGILDVLVLDRATGNARVGYQSSSSNLTWSAPLPTGVPASDALTVGRFFLPSRDAIALTSRELNLVHLADLSNPTANPTISNLVQSGLGPNYLVGLATPYQTNNPFAWLLVGSADNDPSAGSTLLELFALDTYTAPDTASLSNTLARGNFLRLGADPATLAAAMLRGNNDSFVAFSPSNSFGLLLNRTELAPGSDYAFGQFNSESLPRFLFYVPGQTNLLIQSLIQTNDGFVFDAPVSLNFTAAVQRVYYVSQGADGFALIQFGDGIQGLRLPGGTPTLGGVYRAGGGAAGNVFTGVVPLTNGNFALLDAAPGSAASTHAQIVRYNAGVYTQVSAGNLPAIASRNTRATVWLFQTEPFVNPDPGFLASLTVPDWSRSAIVSGGLLSAVSETDGGAGSGLANPTTQNLGSSQGAAWAVAEQYRDSISLFSYAGPRPVDPVVVNITPPAGLYGASISISLSTLNAADQPFYRVGPLDTWHPYAAPFSLTNDAIVQYYATNPVSAARSRLLAANYRFGRGNATTVTTPVDLAPGTTNPAPDFHTNLVILSQHGTVFYGRRSVLAGAGGFLGPSPYLSFADSPFHQTNDFSYFYLETFEDGALNTPGVNANAGWFVTNPSGTTDSVDADDGVINGSGLGGHSFFTPSQHSITLTFDPNALDGHFPTHVGLVWTDVGSVSSGTFGRGSVNFFALDANGVSLGSILGSNLGDSLSTGQTAEDRFFGLVNRGGISSITMSMANSVNWEVDHLQYGYLDPAGFDGTLWAINLDGSGETFITTGARPRASRDGRWLAFLREGDPFNNKGNLWVRDLATGDEAQLFISNPNPLPAAKTNLLVSYDWDLTGTNLVFDYNNRFWSLGLDGVIAQFPLAASLNQNAPSINPVDGSVAFEILYPGPSGLYLAPADLTSKQLLLAYPSGARWPAWSPSGQDLAFADGLVSPVIDGGKNLWVGQFISNNLATYQITGITDNSNGFPHGAQWSPEGDALVGAGAMWNTNGIWVIPLTADGTDCEGPAYLLPTTPGDPIDFVGSVIAAPLPQGVVRPGLFITMTPDAAVVYWSSAYLGFTLESTTDLAFPSTWTAIPGPYNFDGYLYYYSEPVTSLGQQKFFRLHYNP